MPPRAPGPDAEEDSVQEQPVIIPPVPLPPMSRRQWLQPRPLRISQVMPFQPFLIHEEIQPGRPARIYETRPSGTLMLNAVLNAVRRGRIKTRLVAFKRSYSLPRKSARLFAYGKQVPSAVIRGRGRARWSRAAGQAASADGALLVRHARDTHAGTTGKTDWSVVPGSARSSAFTTSVHCGPS